MNSLSRACSEEETALAAQHSTSVEKEKARESRGRKTRGWKKKKWKKKAMIKTGREQEGAVTMGRKKRKSLRQALIIKTNSPGTVYLSAVMKCIHWCNISDACFPPFTRPITSSALIDFERHCCPRGNHVSAVLWVSYMFLWSHCFEASFRQKGLLCQVSSQCVRQRLSSYTTWHLTVDDTSASECSPNPPSASNRAPG